MHFVPPIEAGVNEALALGPAILAAMTTQSESVVTAVVAQGPAIVLGASQRAGRVVNLAAAAAATVPVFRRATSGAAAYIGERAIIFSLCLPNVAALVPDATMRTIINRNVRGFLQGFTRVGALAQYFGREWLAVQHRPAGLLGYETTRDGRVLLEVIAGLDAPFGLPPELVTDEERAIDRWRGKVPLALAEVTRADRDPLDLARTVIEASAARWSQSLEPREPPAIDAADHSVIEPNDPAPWPTHAFASVPCAIGRVDAGWSADGSSLWLGGDALTSRYVLEEIAAHFAADALAGFGLTDDAPLEGARLEDYITAAREARALL